MEDMMQKIKSFDQQNKIISVHFNAAFFFERGVRSLQRNNLEKACKYFTWCVDLDASNPQYRFHLAFVLTELGKYEQSNYLLYYLAQDPNNERSECDFLIANNYVHIGDLEEAEQHIVTYLQKSPEGFYAEEAEELLDLICEELERSPKRVADADAHIHEKHEIACRCLEQGKFVEGTQKLKKIVEEHPHFIGARNNLALAYYYLGQFESAVETIQDILTLEPNNLHALCNLAVFYSREQNRDLVKPIIAGLKKVQPLHLDHHYKLATTLGILGEDERAYELLFLLVKRGLYEDVSLYHYLAVASYNTERWLQAERYWQKAHLIDLESQIASYYIELLKKPNKTKQTKRIPYQYQLPYDVKWKNESSKDNVPEELITDPFIRSSLFWMLEHGDLETKMQAIQSLQLIADEEAEAVLRDFIQKENEEDYVKKMAIYVLRQMGAPSPFEAVLDHHKVTIDAKFVDGKFPVWMENWHKVVMCLNEKMVGSYDLIEQQQAQTLWSKFLRASYPNLPRIRKVEAWAAAIEFLVAQNGKQSWTKKDISAKYGVTVGALTRNLYQIEKNILSNFVKLTKTTLSEK